MLISISGSSGVGKTTLSQLIMMVLGTSRSFCLSGDDLHLWERSSVNWNTFTHLNAAANDLELGHEHLLKLKSGCFVDRRRYNHESGMFDDPIRIYPKDVIIYEGLHAFYLNKTSDLSDVRIFIDTDTELKTEWKIKRDTKKRGYTKRQVVDTMMRRKADEESFIAPQKERADIIVKFIKNRDSIVSMEYVSITDRGSQIMANVKKMYDDLIEFMQTCKWLSLEPSLVQGRGGNVSVKSGDGIIITSSGSAMGDVNIHHGYCIGKPFTRNTLFDSDCEYTDAVISCKTYGEGIPSMETGLHLNIHEKVIIHTHPIHLNAILCSTNSRSIVETLFTDISYDYIEYTTPGFDLVNRLVTESNVVFMENHGIVVGAATAEEAIELTEKINNRCKRWLGNHVESFVESEQSHSCDPLFPDAAVFLNEMRSVNSYIHGLIHGACLVPRYLSREEIEKLNGMRFEKYRQSGQLS